MQRFKHMARHVGRHIDLPTQLAHISHAVHTGEAHAQLDFLGGAEWVHRIAKVIGRNGLQQFARVWPHNGQDAFASCHVCNDHVEITLIAAHPCLIGKTRRGGCHDKITVLFDPRDGHIRFDPRLGIQELCVDNFANWYIIITATDVVHKGHCITALDTQFPEGCHVIHAYVIAHCVVFGSHVVKEVLAFP